jgi:hypothetical protein
MKMFVTKKKHEGIMLEGDSGTRGVQQRRRSAHNCYGNPPLFNGMIILLALNKIRQ